MGTLIGREDELRLGRAVLDDAQRQHVARLLRIAGPSGIGKTAVSEGLLSYAIGSGWMFATVQAHRIQASLPFAAARRLVVAVISNLRDDGGKYASGLESEIDAATAPGAQAAQAIEAALLRLFEAILLDRSLVIVVENAQWMDAESRTLLVRLLRALADRPIVLISTERSDATSGPVFEFDDAFIIVDELSIEATTELARSLLPGAPEDVVKAIGERARGRALDVVALAQSASDPTTITMRDVTATLRALVARELALYDAETREFVQICSLASDPVDYDLLRKLWPDDRKLVEHIELSTGRFFVQESDTLRFVHDAISQSVRETIAIEIPYRKRIIEALEQLPLLRQDDYERLVDQAASLGDRGREKAYLERLVDDAEKRGVYQSVASGLERIISLTPFEPAISLPLYEKLSVIYNMLARDNETHRVCSAALDQALSAGTKAHLGQLVASDLFALYLRGERQELDHTLERFREYLDAPEDRAALLALRLFIACVDYDDEAFEQSKLEYEMLANKYPLLDIRFAAFEGMRLAYDGATSEAGRVLARGRMAARQNAPALVAMIDAENALIAFQTFGPNHPSTSEALARLSEGSDLNPVLSANAALMTGNAQDAIGQATEALVHFDGTHPRRSLIGIAAMASALSGTPLAPPIMRMAESDAATLKGAPSGWLIPSVSACALLLADRDSGTARSLLNLAIESLSKKALDPMIIFYPIILTRAAIALQDRAALRMLAEGALKHNRFPFSVASYDLAEFAANKALGVRTSTPPTPLSSQFTAMGAPFFASIAADQMQEPQTSAQGTERQLSRREREVVALVADGKTNREIAEQLVLSERTVEAHVANIFGKLNVSSRVQVASWFTRNHLTNA